MSKKNKNKKTTYVRPHMRRNKKNKGKHFVKGHARKKPERKVDYLRKENGYSEEIVDKSVDDKVYWKDMLETPSGIQVDDVKVDGEYPGGILAYWDRVEEMYFYTDIYETSDGDFKVEINWGLDKPDNYPYNPEYSDSEFDNLEDEKFDDVESAYEYAVEFIKTNTGRDKLEYSENTNGGDFNAQET